MRSAARFVMGECGDPKCDAIHFWLFETTTEGIEPFAQMTIAADDVSQVAEAMKSWAYAKIAMRDT